MPQLPIENARGLVCEALDDSLGGVSVRSMVSLEPTNRQALIRVNAAALNFPDLLMTQGRYQFHPEPPFVIGMEGCGHIVALGDDAGDQFRVGQRVVFQGKTGACADYAVTDVDDLQAAPSVFDDAEAAAYSVGAVTAYASLVERARLRAGQTLLVHGASGGMGMAAVQLGLRLGARVIATTRSDAAHETLHRLGVHDCLSLEADWPATVKALTHGDGVDTVFDPVGGDIFDGSMRAVRWGGTVLIVGFTSGRIAQMATNHALIKGLSIFGVRAGEMGRRDPAVSKRINDAVWGLAEHRSVAPVIGARFSLAEGKQALEAMRDREFVGKIVIENDRG